MLAVVAVASLVAAGCGDEEPAAVAPGLLESLPPGDYEPAGSLSELAARSDRVVMGSIVDVEEGWWFDESPNDLGAKHMVELIVESGEMDGPIHVNWPYVAGFEIDAVRDAMPIGSRVVLYLVDFRTIAEDPRWYHTGPDDEHTHWVLTTPQGVIMADPETGAPILGDPSLPFDDEPPAGSDLVEWIAETPLGE